MATQVLCFHCIALIRKVLFTQEAAIETQPSNVIKKGRVAGILMYLKEVDSRGSLHSTSGIRRVLP